MPSRVVLLVALVAALVLSCVGPRRQLGAGLRLQPEPGPAWTVAADGLLSTSLLRLRVIVRPQPNGPRLEITVENPSSSSALVSLGPEATRSPDAAIGELQHRRRDRAQAEGTSDYLPFRSMQPVTVASGFNTVFFLDCPLGREATIGQYFVLVIEVSAGGRRERRLLPVLATNVVALSRGQR